MLKLVLVLSLVMPLPAHGTSCFGPITVCSAYESNAIVFRGRVLEVTADTRPPREVTYPDGSKEMVHIVPMTETIRFEVLETFRGDPGHEITITAGRQGFHPGSEYVVFAMVNPATQMTSTSVCSRTHPIVNPSTDADLAWLRAYPNASPTASIFGSATMQYGTKDIPPISVQLAGPDGRPVSSGEGVSYVFRDLAPGAYTLTASAPAGFAALPARTVSVAAKGCAEVDWFLQYDSHIKGTVTDAAGNLLSNISIGLLSPASNRTGFSIITFQSTDRNGNYDFARIPPGDYWVALYPLGPNNREPHAPVFYPSGSSALGAKLLHLPPSGTLTGLNLVLPEALHAVAIHLRVINQDGTPANRAHIAADDPLTPGQFIGATANANGEANITLYEGRHYSLTANTAGYREPACGGPVKFFAKEGLALGTLVLDKTVDECRALQRAK